MIGTIIKEGNIFKRTWSAEEVLDPEHINKSIENLEKLLAELKTMKAEIEKFN